jgi:hypothetical protein
MKSVYYLLHGVTQRRLRWYPTLAGARIAQRARNRGLGFKLRLERVATWDNWEVERCLVGDQIVDATWCIQEGTVDQADLEEVSECDLPVSNQGPAA